ncbi:MAG: hypothetical protein J2P13_13185, partial [Acidobacteria bacterium]|nr:hypothetical protein [Acidobacteriota bacterium]
MGVKGIRRTHGTAQHGKTALLTADLVQIVAHVPTSLLGTRDRALALVGYAGGLRALGARRSSSSGSEVYRRRRDRDHTAIERRPGRKGKEGGSPAGSPSRQL